MSSLRPEDRVSLCKFMFADGRRCRTPRLAGHPNFCYYHAQKESRASAATKLGEDLAFFFSGDYLSANDLAAALGRILPAVIRGDIQPRLARTVAYYAQTLIQTIHLAQNEYIRACGERDWRQSVRDSLNQNFDYQHPPAPKPSDRDSEPAAISHPPSDQPSLVVPAAPHATPPPPSDPGAAPQPVTSSTSNLDTDAGSSPALTSERTHATGVEAGLQPGSSPTSTSVAAQLPVQTTSQTITLSEPKNSAPSREDRRINQGALRPERSSSSVPSVSALGPETSALAMPRRLSPPRRKPAPKTPLESTLTDKPVTVDSK